MGDQPDGYDGLEGGHPRAAARRPILLVLLALLLLVEAIAVLGVGIWLIAQLASSTPDSYATAIALIVLVLAAGVWVFFIAVGVFRMRPWTRGAALTWQVLQLIVAVCCFQGVFGDPVDGWPLALFAVLGVALLLSPPVVAVTRREV